MLRKAACKVDAWLASGNLDFRMVSSTPLIGQAHWAESVSANTVAYDAEHLLSF